MTKIIKKFGKPSNPHGVQLFCDNTVRLRDDSCQEYTGMNFGAALEAMKAGKAVRLPHWSPEVQIQLQKPDEHSKMTHAYMYVRSRFGCVPWIPTQVELLSMDWQISKHVE